jgi:tetratricopeptide (TPR) repeat protein
VINFLLGLAASMVVGGLLVVLKVSPWLSAPAGILVGIGLFIYLGRRTQAQLEKIFNRAGELLKKQQFDPAIEVIKEGYKLGPWQFLVKGSIDGQIGVIQYLRKKNEEAEPLLRSASSQHYIAKAMLAILQWKRGEKVEARASFDAALKSGKKESLLYAVYAYFLNEIHERDAAIAVLNRGLKVCEGDDRLLTNRNLLQNNKAMKMKVYGEQWYQFMLEKPMVRQEPPPFARISKRALRG